ncbi:hypothetical protein [Cognatiluteimonas lumbrici]|uniref:hypothetical protein n=1 Tax=Cognatiluteimonas lumbrici TaxID=2559601 RepID=UPI001127D5CC|nr:hypothetical protein [Luteimonas lumbrici]
MDNWRDELGAIKARLAVQHLALRALVRSHPDPTAVLDEWRKLRADSVAAAYALPTEMREWLTDQVHAFAEEWTAELTRAAAAET